MLEELQKQLPKFGDRVPEVIGYLVINGKPVVLTKGGILMRYGAGWGRYQYPVTIGGVVIRYIQGEGVSIKTRDKTYCGLVDIQPEESGRFKASTKEGETVVFRL